MVNCADQAEIDHYWSRLLEGGHAEQCGWLRDRYGLSWQIVPEAMSSMMAHPDRDSVRRVTEAMLQMVKFDIAELERAFDGG
jgi:predicted 3-demethylubiquinone-9 3-methyltransferase (glyoxalase superfamily)